MGEEVRVPGQITLMPDEQALYEQIEFDPNSLSPGFHERLTRSCDAAKPLVLSLLRRGAIPAIRWEYFVNPEYHVGSKRSRLEIFESNGTRGEEILEHGNFLKYLDYFIHGPKLPLSVSDGFCTLINRDRDRSELRAYARNQIRALGLDRHRAARLAERNWREGRDVMSAQQKIIKITARGLTKYIVASPAAQRRVLEDFKYAAGDEPFAMARTIDR